MTESVTVVPARARPVPAPATFAPPDDVFLPVQRLPRGPLHERAAQLGRELDALPPDGSPLELSALLNQASLVFAEAADSARAERICLAQLDMLAARYTASGEPRLAVAALQPWINLGRLRVLAGDWAAGVEHLALARAVEGRGELRLGPLHVAAANWPAVLDVAPDLAAVAAAVEVVEVTKAVLRARRPDVLHGWLVRWLGSPTTRAVPHLLEARILYGLHMRRWGDARRLAEEAGGRLEAGSWPALVLAYWTACAEVADAAGQGCRPPEDRCLSLAAAVAEPGEARPYDHARLTAAVADLLGAVGLADAAGPLLLHAAELAAADPDEPLTARLLLRAHVATGSGPASARRLRALCARSRYAEVRRRVHAVAGCRPHRPYPPFLPALDAAVRAALVRVRQERS